MTFEEFERLPLPCQLAELVELAQTARYHWRDQSDAADTLRHFFACMNQHDLNQVLTALEETLVQVRYHWRDRTVVE